MITVLCKMKIRQIRHQRQMTVTELNDEAILTQLGYPVTDQTLAQARRVRGNTAGFDHIGKHLIALNDHLKPLHSFVGLSNHRDHYKIKNEAQVEAIFEETEETIQKWAQKYKVRLEQGEEPGIYYILGVA